jgi:hypothetical protein
MIPWNRVTDYEGVYNNPVCGNAILKIHVSLSLLLLLLLLLLCEGICPLHNWLSVTARGR